MKMSDEDLLREALLNIRRVKQENEALTRRLQARTVEPIAIVGAACRFPGGVATLEQYWDFLLAERNAIETVPADRWPMEGFYDADPDRPGRCHVPYGGFLRDIDQFDNTFFEVSPREASCLDPKQRLLLEVAWEAIENATLSKHALGRESVGVYVGISGSEYLEALPGLDVEMLSGYHVGGTAASMAAGRLSYALGLTGPSIALDTSCSSSLVALHLAGQALRLGECSSALVCATNLMLSPRTTIAIGKAGMLSADGQCKAFAEDANGYVRSEGCAVLVLRKLSDAIDSGLPILGIVRGTAVNQDGGAGGLTVPNSAAQEQVIRAALDAAGLEPGDVHMIEAHGTGTALGDPIEMLALRQVFEKRPFPLLVGSAKTNLGHLEACAGMAGLMKAVLALERRRLPAHLHLHRPSPAIPWGSWPVRVPTQATDLPAEGPLYAGVSSFGFSGTNAHVVIESPPQNTGGQGGSSRSSVLMCSAKRKDALPGLAEAYADRLSAMDPESLASACYTSAVGRDHFRYRLAVAGVPGPALVAALRQQAFDASKPAQGLRIAMLLTDDAAGEVGHEMLRDCTTFRELVQACEQAWAAWRAEGGSALPWEPGSLPGDALPSELGSFVIQYCAAQRWRLLGIEPDALLAQGVGEYVAAALAGALPLGDALRWLGARAALKGETPEERAGLEAVFRSIRWQEPECEIFSLQSGDVTIEALRSIDHWLSREIGAGRAGGAVTAEKDIDAVLCVGPAGISADIQQRLDPHGARQWLATFVPGQGDWSVQAHTSASLHRAGVQMDWSRWHAGHEMRRVRLPNYPFQRRRFWLAGPQADDLLALAPIKHLPAMADSASAQADSHGNDRYRLYWRRDGQVASSAPGQLAGQRWLVLADASLAPGLAQLAMECGVTVIPVVPDSPDHGGAGEGVWLDGKRHAGFAQLLDALEGARVDHVVHMWSIDAAGIDDWRAQQKRVCGSLVELVQQLHRRSLRPRLSIVTEFAQPVDAGAVKPHGASLWGLVRSLAAEHPELACKCIDWDRTGAGESVLWTELCTDREENLVAYRNGLRHVLRCERSVAHDAQAPGAEPAPRLRLDGTYVVTGGLGFLGCRVAQSLASLGAGHIVLVGRSAPSGSARARVDAAIDAVRKFGASISIEHADVADPAEVTRLVALCNADASPLRGVVHAAGVLDDGLLTDLGWDRFERVMGAKVAGARQLHLCTQTLPLDFFVLFSSTASMFMSPGQGNYAAANAYLDALAAQRRAIGLTAISINWGAWEGSEMLSVAARANVQRASGDLGFLQVEAGMRAFESLLFSREAQVGVVAVDWEKVGQRAATMGLAVPPLLRKLANTGAAGVANASESFWAEFDALPQPDRGSRLSRFIAEQLRAVLALDAQSLTDPKQPFHELGLDSLMSLEIRNRLQARLVARLAAPLPQDVLLDQPNLERLTAFLVGAISGGATQAAQAHPAESAQARLLVCLQRGEHRVPPLVLVHPIGGSVSCYVALAHEMAPSRPVFALRSASGNDAGHGYKSVPQLAADYVAAVRASGIEGACILGGHSMGGVIAFEMARQLRALGQAVEKLFIIDSPRPASEFLRSQLNGEASLRRIFCLDMGLSQTDADALAEDDHEGDSGFLHRVRAVAASAGAIAPDVSTKELGALYQRLCWHAEALLAYSPQAEVADLLYYQAEQTPWSSAFDWGPLVRTTIRCQVPGDHFSVLHQRGARLIGKHLQQALLRSADTPQEEFES